MENAIKLNPFDSTHFIWMDLGINHVAKNPMSINEWINKIPVSKDLKKYHPLHFDINKK
jgi:hypothetical protein